MFQVADLRSELWIRDFPLDGPSGLGDSEWDASTEELREEEQAELRGCVKWCGRNGEAEEEPLQTPNWLNPGQFWAS